MGGSRNFFQGVRTIVNIEILGVQFFLYTFCIYFEKGPIYMNNKI
jgi:hypothetical protein